MNTTLLLQDLKYDDLFSVHWFNVLDFDATNSNILSRKCHSDIQQDLQEENEHENKIYLNLWKWRKLLFQLPKNGKIYNQIESYKIIIFLWNPIRQKNLPFTLL